MKGYFDEHSVMDNERWERRGRDAFSRFLAIAVCLCLLACAWIVAFGPPRSSGPCGGFVTRDAHGALWCVSGRRLDP